MEYYNVAAQWWADKLRNVSTDNFNNGDDSEKGIAGMFLAAMCAKSTKISDEAIDAFEEALAEHIKEHFEICGYLSLLTDYGPQGILADTAREVGISTNAFPWKTSMWIEKNSISVSCGYAAKTERIFPESN